MCKLLDSFALNEWQTRPAKPSSIFHSFGQMERQAVSDKCDLNISHLFLARFPVQGGRVHFNVRAGRQFVRSIEGCAFKGIASFAGVR